MAFDWALPYPANRQPVFAQNMVATSQPLATAAGLAAAQIRRECRGRSPCSGNHPNGR